MGESVQFSVFSIQCSVFSIQWLVFWEGKGIAGGGVYAPARPHSLAPYSFAHSLLLVAIRGDENGNVRSRTGGRRRRLDFMDNGSLLRWPRRLRGNRAMWRHGRCQSLVHGDPRRHTMCVGLDYSMRPCTQGGEADDCIGHRHVVHTKRKVNETGKARDQDERTLCYG